MQNLQPPTDNLYKFIALTGVVTCIVAILWPTNAFYSLRLKEIEFAGIEAKARTDDALYRATVKFEMERRQRLIVDQSKLNKFMAEHDPNSLPPDVRELSRQEAIRLSQESRDIDALGRPNAEVAATADKAFATVDAMQKELDFMKWTAVATLVIAIVMFVTGLIAAVAGFSLWYCRTQIHQDKVLAAEAAKQLQPLKLIDQIS